ncbi:DedA family protein [Sciscionella marina]|uniref:DedA family protein n=1 Tax=Sciscionella marina TaxID=508770 RepID=UPI0003669304|nr:DedA family protein [Sciscionella marina]
MVEQLLQAIPPVAVYVIVGVIIMIESLGIPIPGEITLVSAALLSSRHELAVSPLWIAICGSAGAIIGDSIGFAIGHRYGGTLFGWLGRKFPRHFGPKHVAFAERIFTKYGVWAVFFGRFILVLRIFAGPLAGSLRMPYLRFLAANALGGIVWASGTAYLLYYVGMVAETWLSRFSYLGLILVVLSGLAIGLFVKHRMGKLVERENVSGNDRSTGPLNRD